MVNKLLVSFLLALIFSVLLSISKAEQLESRLYSQQIIFPKTSNFSYNVQKYLGLNFFVKKITESLIKVIFKLRTRARKVSINLEIYSGFDLLRKRAKSLSLKAEKLFIKDIPLENFLLLTKDPIFFKGRKVIYSLRFELQIKINLSEINNVLNNIPKWKKVFSKLELPIPPFGYTEISVSDLQLSVNDSGNVYAKAVISSLVNPRSEPLFVDVTGDLIVQDNKIIVSNLKSSVEDIFTETSDAGKEFSRFLEDLINPVFDFHKVEGNGLTIDDVGLSFGFNSLFLKIESRLLP